MHRIHRASLINYGVLPLPFLDAADCTRIEQGDALIIEDIAAQLRSGKPVQVRNASKGFTLRTRSDLSAEEIDILQAGGLISREKALLAQVMRRANG